MTRIETAWTWSRAHALLVAVAFGALLAAVLLATARSAPPAPPAPSDPGALVRTTVSSEVGVVLDEIPASIRTRVANTLLRKPDAFWSERAKAQLRLTNYRLVFRFAFYNKDKQALPLPP